MLLGAASQRIEVILTEMFGNEWMRKFIEKWKKEERGAVLGFAEWGVVIFFTSNVNSLKT